MISSLQITGIERAGSKDYSKCLAVFAIGFFTFLAVLVFMNSFYGWTDFEILLAVTHLLNWAFFFFYAFKSRHRAAMTMISSMSALTIPLFLELYGCIDSGLIPG